MFLAAERPVGDGCRRRPRPWLSTPATLAVDATAVVAAAVVDAAAARPPYNNKEKRYEIHDR